MIIRILQMAANLKPSCTKISLCFYVLSKFWTGITYYLAAHVKTFLSETLKLCQSIFGNLSINSTEMANRMTTSKSEANREGPQEDPSIYTTIFEPPIEQRTFFIVFLWIARIYM